MIKFDEELKNFKPSLEIEQSADVIYQQDFVDATDVVLSLMQNDGKDGKTQNR